MRDTPISSDDWRAAMGSFPSGVTVVTSWNADKPVGSTVSSFCSVSLTPPLLLVCIDKQNPLNGPLLEAGVFGVHILGLSDGDLGMRFATAPEDERFTGLNHRQHDGGAPHIPAAPLFIDCEIEQIHRAGTHDIVIGRGLRILKGETEPPLVYHQGGFFQLQDGG